MSMENEDRGDEFEVATGDDAGDTADQTNKEPEAKEPEGKEPEGDAKEPEGKEPEGKDKKILIPKDRFDQAVGKARAAEKAALEKAEKLEQELKASKGQIDAEKVEKDLDDLEEKLEKAIADGNTELKTKLRRDIRNLTQALSDAKAQAHAAYATAVAIEQVRYDAVVERMETEHPELNPDNEEGYDEDIVAEIMEYKTAFEAAGKSSTEALKKALKAVYGSGKPTAEVTKGGKPVKGDKGDEEPEEDKAAKAKKAEELATKRKEDAIKKALDTKEKQPADVKKAGMDSDKAGKAQGPKNVADMSDKDFDKLTDEEKAKLRGDVM